MRVYVTKYALTTGVVLVEVEKDKYNDRGMVQVKHNKNEIYHRFEYALSESEALAIAEEMRARKIKSLTKQLTKLQNMTFTVRDLTAKKDDLP